MYYWYIREIQIIKQKISVKKRKEKMITRDYDEK